MTLSSKHLVMLILLLASIPVADATIESSFVMSDVDKVVQDCLLSLVSGPLLGNDILLISEEYNQRMLDMGAVMKAAGSTFTPVFLATQHSILHNHRPPHHTKGSALIAIIIVHHDPTAFLISLEKNKDWNPGYLMFLCLNTNINTTHILTHPVVQRSAFISLLQPQHYTVHQILFDDQELVDNFEHISRLQKHVHDKTFSFSNTKHVLDMTDGKIRLVENQKYLFDNENHLINNKNYSTVEQLLDGQQDQVDGQKHLIDDSQELLVDGQHLIHHKEILSVDENYSDNNYKSFVDGRKYFIYIQERLVTYTSLPGRIKVPLGVWSPENFPSLKQLFPPRFLDFGGEILGVSVLCYDEPFIYFPKHEGPCIGSNVDALQIIGDKLNFKFTMTSPESIVWGFKENGTWNGMLGQVMYEGQKLIINVMQPNPERADDFDYTYPYWEDGFGIMIRKPPPVPLWRNILYPFSTLTWAILFITTVLMATSLAMILHSQHVIHDLIGFALKVASGLLGQSMDYKCVVLWWARLWLVIWWICVDVLAAAYTSNLVAVLTVPVYPTRINTLQDLAQSHLIPSMEDYGDFVPQALKSSKNPTLSTLGKKLYLEPTSPETYGPLVKKVMKGTHAVMITFDYLIYIQHSKGLTHSAYIMQDKIFSSYMSWFLPKNTPYTNIISDYVIRLLETGVLVKLYRDHQGNFITKEKQVLGDVVLNLEHLQGAYIALGIGLVCACILLLIERIV